MIGSDSRRKPEQHNIRDGSAESAVRALSTFISCQSPADACFLALFYIGNRFCSVLFLSFLFFSLFFLSFFFPFISFLFFSFLFFSFLFFSFLFVSFLFFSFLLKGRGSKDKHWTYLLIKNVRIIQAIYIWILLYNTYQNMHCQNHCII